MDQCVSAEVVNFVAATEVPKSAQHRSNVWFDEFNGVPLQDLHSQALIIHAARYYLIYFIPFSGDL